MALTRRSFLATILGSATAAMLVDVPQWIWTPTVDAPPVVASAILTMDQILAVLASKVERELTRPLRIVGQHTEEAQEEWSRRQRRAWNHRRWSSVNTNRVIENLVLPLTVSHEGPEIDKTLTYAARTFVHALRDARLTLPLPRLENEIKEGHYRNDTTGLTLRGMVYEDQKPFFLPDGQFAIRIDAAVV